MLPGVGLPFTCEPSTHKLLIITGPCWDYLKVRQIYTVSVCGPSHAHLISFVDYHLYSVYTSFTSDLYSSSCLFYASTFSTHFCCFSTLILFSSVSTFPTLEHSVLLLNNWTITSMFSSVQLVVPIVLVWTSLPLFLSILLPRFCVWCDLNWIYLVAKISSQLYLLSTLSWSFYSCFQLASLYLFQGRYLFSEWFV